MEMAVESMEMAPGAIPRPGWVPEQRLLSPESRLRRRRRYGTFRGFLLGSLGFSIWRHLIGEEATRGGARGAHTTPGRGLDRAWAPRKRAFMEHTNLDWVGYISQNTCSLNYDLNWMSL